MCQGDGVTDTLFLNLGLAVFLSRRQSGFLLVGRLRLAANWLTESYHSRHLGAGEGPTTRFNGNASRYSLYFGGSPWDDSSTGTAELSRPKTKNGGGYPRQHDTVQIAPAGYLISFARGKGRGPTAI